MDKGRAVVESSTYEGVISFLTTIQEGFSCVSATEPVKTWDGRFISSVHYSNDTTIMEARPECG